MNLKGGYKILSLVTLVLIASVDGTTATNITDANTLEQLDSLKEYLDVSKQLKPILLRVKPSKEKVVMAELSRVNDVTLMIHAKLDGYELNIVVAFEQDVETLLWSIDEAQYLYVKTVTSEVGIKGLIQADKDILSQIEVEYDSDNNRTIFTFPKNVMPLRWYISNLEGGIDVFFDYIGENIIDEEFNVKGTLFAEGAQVQVIIGGNHVLNDDDFDWIYSSYIYLSSPTSSINTYYLYHPITSADLPPNVENAEEGTPVKMLGLDEDGEVVKSNLPASGTKLYKHTITRTGVAQVVLINTSSTPIDFSNFNGYSFGDYYSSCVSAKIGTSFAIGGFSPNSNSVMFRYCTVGPSSVTAAEVEINTNSTDTVTEL